MLKKFIKININSCSNWSRILIDFQSFLTRPSVTTKRIPNFLLVPWARNLLSLHSFSYSFHLPRFLFPVLHLQEPIVITPPHHFFWEMVEANNGSSFLTSTISLTFRLVLHLSEVLSIINLIETFLTTFLRFLWVTTALENASCHLACHPLFPNELLGQGHNFYLDRYL